MNKLTKRQYVMMIADSITNEYGSSLAEYGTDVAMAEAAVKRLTPYLYFRKETISASEYKAWKKERSDAELPKSMYKLTKRKEQTP